MLVTEEHTLERNLSLAQFVACFALTVQHWFNTCVHRMGRNLLAAQFEGK